MPRNVILITTDQQRFDSLGCNGSSHARTPNLDALAAGGVRFLNHIATNPVCSPSRGSLMTGLFPSENGLWANGCELPHDIPTIPDVMSEHGFQTAHFGKLHLEPIVSRVDDPHPYGFETCKIAEGDQQLTHDAYFGWLRQNHPQQFLDRLSEMYAQGQATGYTSKLPEELHLSRWITDRAVDWLANGRDRDRPFFLNLGYFDPHHAFDPVEPYASWFADAEIPPPVFDEAESATKPEHYRKALKWMRPLTEDPERILAIQRAYHAMCAHLDCELGRLLAALDAEGLAADTAVIFTSDHGEFLGEHGMLWKGPFLLDDLLRVPMIVAIPGSPIPARVVTEATSMVDILSTVQTLAGVEANKKNASGLPMLDANFEPFPEGNHPEILTEWDAPGDSAECSQRCIRTATHKLVHYQGSEVGELYDLTADPRETRNLYSDASMKAIREELEQRLQARHLRARPTTPKMAPW